MQPGQDLRAVADESYVRALLHHLSTTQRQLIVVDRNLPHHHNTHARTQTHTQTDSEAWIEANEDGVEVRAFWMPACCITRAEARWVDANGSHASAHCNADSNADETTASQSPPLTPRGRGPLAQRR
jgi:hypothetical protein